MVWQILLGGMFAVGFFLTAVQAVRVRTIAKLANYTDSEPVIEWSVVEINVGVIIACVPAFAPLVRFFGTKASSLHSRSKSRSKSTQKPSGEGFPLSPMNSPPMPDPDSKTRSTGPVKSPTHSTRFTEDDDDEVELWTQRHEMNDDVYVWSDAGKTGPGSEIADSRKSDLEAGSNRVSETGGLRVSWTKPGHSGIVVVRDIRIS